MDLGRVVKPCLDHCLGAWKVLIDQLIGRCLFGELEKLRERRFGRWPMQVCIRLEKSRHGLTASPRRRRDKARMTDLIAVVEN